MSPCEEAWLDAMEKELVALLASTNKRHILQQNYTARVLCVAGMYVPDGLWYAHQLTDWEWTIYLENC